MPKSRWSESTIQSIQTFEDEEDDSEVTQSEDSEDETDDASVLEMRRLSRHALKPVSINTTYTARPGLAPKRPPMRSLDSVDNFIRRGGWKRRGIVFHKDDLDNQRCEQDRNSF
jgi:hypothetical protein